MGPHITKKYYRPKQGKRETLITIESKRRKINPIDEKQFLQYWEIKLLSR